MYVYNFVPTQKPINFNEIFVVMPFDEKYDSVLHDLIEPATEEANSILKFNESKQKLHAYRTKDDIRTTSGWINVLEHLTRAQIVMGVLTGNNPNVFYELGIAHATQHLTRQILLAKEGYKPKFDIKDLIYYQYKKDLKTSIIPLAQKIADAIKWHKIEEEKIIHQARMLLGPYEFEVIMDHGYKNFINLHSSSNGRESYENDIREKHKNDLGYAVGVFDRHAHAISNLCIHGLLGLDTSSSPVEGGVNVTFAYYWTELGNSVLQLLKIITKEELGKRREKMPIFFEK